MKKYILAGLLCCSSAVLLLAQSTRYRDVQSRNDIALRLDLPKNFSANIQYQIRFIDNISSIGGHYGSLSLGYKLNKYLSFDADYRLAYFPSNDPTVNRFGLSLTGRYKYKKFTPSIRILSQRSFAHFLTDETEVVRQTLRTRAELEYEINKHVNVSLSTEPFWRFKNTGNYFWRLRNMASVGWEYKKRQRVSANIMWQSEYNRNAPQDILAFGLSWDYSMKIKSHKKKHKKNKSKHEN